MVPKFQRVIPELRKLTANPNTYQSHSRVLGLDIEDLVIKGISVYVFKGDLVHFCLEDLECIVA